MLKTMTTLAAAALVWAAPAGAVSEVQDPRDAQGAPIVPGGPLDRPALSETPQREAAPAREIQRKEIRKDLDAWRERVEAWRREHEAYGGEEEAAKLADALQLAEQSWRKLAQSSGANWDRAMHQMEQAREELTRAWEDANG